jgi:4-amino-4-deoxy-L-arabinose transferase-like glycosyltransferase
VAAQPWRSGGRRDWRKGQNMLIALLILFILGVIVFGILSFTVHHLFLIGFIIAIILLLGHFGFLARRHA